MEHATTIQLFCRQAWHDVAVFSVLEAERGYRSSGSLRYDVNYAAQHLHATGHQALSVRYPIDLQYHQLPSWPAFLLDLLPAGAGRRALLNLHNLPDQEARSDWLLLNMGAFAPPGNLRIRSAVHPTVAHAGFARDDIIRRKAEFLAYARQQGAPVAGSTGAQGDAPKFLLTEDKKGRWHADGALVDAQAKQHYLVKFPRGNRAADRVILRHEAMYYAIAKHLGLTVGALPLWQDDVLFVPRFDRAVQGKVVQRHGLESLCSVAGVADFGQAISLFTLCEAFLPFVDDPTQAITEFLLRDIANCAMGNTDNHARNTALIKWDNGGVTLSPLYDFAPMQLDPEGIVRTCRWVGHESGLPEWWQVIDTLKRTPHLPEIAWDRVCEKVSAVSALLTTIPEQLHALGADDQVIQMVKTHVAMCVQQIRKGR